MQLKKFYAFMIGIILILVCIPTTVFAQGINFNYNETTETSTQENVYHKKPEKQTYKEKDALKNDDLFKQYVEKKINAKTTPSTIVASRARKAAISAGDKLLENNKKVYDILLSKVKKIANGEVASTEIEITMAELGRKTSYTAEELGVNLNQSEDCIFEDMYDYMMGFYQFDIVLVHTALLSDCPYELYWYDKTSGTMYDFPMISVYKDPQTKKYTAVFEGNITFAFYVAKAYMGADEFTVDTSKITKVNNAISKAQSIVNDASSKSDYEKLIYYRDQICKLTSYDFSIDLNNIVYGDPWQLIYVFDGDTNTKVVCEGYSKAFKYLCDLTTFKRDIGAIAVFGTIQSELSNGPHMWNIVKMENGKYYLVDITNCDDGSTASNTLFLAGASSGNVSNGYTVEDIKYTYDAYILSTFDEELILNSSRYTPTTYIAQGTCGDNLTWELSNEGTLTISGTGDMYDYHNTQNYPWKDYISSIKKVIIEDGVETIGKCAFYNCQSLTEVSLANTILKINAYAFDSCNALTTINLHNNITEIGEGAFKNCTSLTGINIPNKLKYINDDTFDSCTSLKSIKIPNSVTRIYEQAFNNCTSLTSITIPGSVESIENAAFSNCNKLLSIILDEGVKNINSGAFANCSALKSVEFPSTIENIKARAFSCCSSITHIYFNGTSKEWFSKNMEIADNNYLLSAQLHCAYVNIKINCNAGTHNLTNTKVKAKSTIEFTVTRPKNYHITHIALNLSVSYSIENTSETTEKISITLTEQDIEINIDITEHKLLHYPKIDATCMNEGFIEYWHCPYCDKYYSDSEGKHQIQQVDIITPRSGHVYSQATVFRNPTCTETGLEHVKCDICGHEEDRTIPAIGHNLTHISAKEPTKEADGNIEYWECENCHALFLDKNATQPTTKKKVIIPKLIHNLTLVSAKDATCTEDGNTAYYVCKDPDCNCGKYYSDKFGQNEITDHNSVIIPKLGHNIEHKAKADPTCEKDGHEEYWECSRCHQKYSDANGEHPIDKATSIPKLGHDFDMEHGEQTKAPTCTESGVMTYKCTRSGCTKTTTKPIDPLGHDLKKVERVEPTRDEDGHIEYWECARCHKKFNDDKASKELSAEALVIPAIGAAQLNEETSIGNVNYKVTNPSTDGTGTVAVIGSTIDGVNISIPATITYKETVYKVTKIAYKAFYGNKTIKTITIGSNVTVIDSYAFYGCSNLTKVYGGYRVQTIGTKAFAYCSRLSSFTITSPYLKKISPYTFYKDKKLKTIKINKTTKLTKSGVKKSLKGSKVKTVKVKKSKIKKYKKYFTKKNCGRRVKVKK